jgi:hypothetical protein
MNFRKWLEGLEPGPQQQHSPNGPNPMQIPVRPDQMTLPRPANGIPANRIIKKPKPLGELGPEFPGTARPPFAEK